jgi:ketosteroid isomerase-like protein
MNRTGEAAAVHALAESLRNAINDSNIDGIVGCWAPAGIMLPPNRPPVYGAAAIREYFAGVFSSRRFTFTFTDWAVDVFSDVAIERLHYTALAVSSDGTTAQDVGKGIHVCTRRADGTWQLAQDIWNSDGSSNSQGAQ